MRVQSNGWRTQGRCSGMSGGVALVQKGFVIPVGECRISRIAKDASERYAIYLPRRLNRIWRELHDKNAMVMVTIEITEIQEA